MALLCSCMPAAGATAAPTGRAEGTDALGQAALSDEAGLRAAGHRRRERRIVGGTKATGNYKWATLITKIGGVNILCTGSIISDRWMVTAAHCILNSQDTVYRKPARELGPRATLLTRAIRPPTTRTTMMWR